MGSARGETAAGRLAVAPATAGQREDVAELWRRTGLTTSYNDPGTDFDRARGMPGSEVLVGMIAGRVVATVMVGHDGHRGWLNSVAVAPDLQGRGYGVAMVAAAEAWLAERGVPKAQLLIRGRNAKVQALERLAYERSDVLVMQRWLTPPQDDARIDRAIPAADHLGDDPSRRRPCRSCIASTPTRTWRTRRTMATATRLSGES